MMFFLVLAMTLMGGTVAVEWQAEGIPSVHYSDLGHRITLPGAVPSAAPGSPLLPRVPLRIVLPDGAVAVDISIVSLDGQNLSGRVVPMPAQKAVPLSRPEDHRTIEPNPAEYARQVPVHALIANQGTLMGYNVVDVLISPFEWNPTTQRLYFADGLTLLVSYDYTGCFGAIPERGIIGSALASSIVQSAVINPEHIPARAAASLDELPWGEYLIIARDDLAEAFEPLAQWKTWKGVPARIVTMGYVTDNYSGVDEAQKLRFFLHDIYQDSPPTYILLAGDTPGIPHRNCYATAEGYTGSPSSDLYFQDMNDTAPGVDAWDLDGDGIWGELNGDDNMDYHPDYVLGRASVETIAEAEIFVNKVLAFENSPDTADWYTSMGFTTEILWSSPYCPGSAGKEKVDTLYTPSSWSITKLYQSAGTQSYAATMAMLNTGMQLVNHAGHGSQGMVSIGNGSLSISDFMGLTNISQNGRPTIWNTIACNSGWFDGGTCLAEAWIRSPGGGGFCIMNTRYGWGEPSEPGDQWSELVDQEFFRQFFIQDMYQLGVAFMMAKDEFVPLIPVDTHYDWIAKSNTLFGDPELPMYTTEPGDLEVGQIVLYEGLEELTVSVYSGGGPLEDARVCLTQGEWDEPVTYAVGITDASGNALLTWPGILPALPGTARITVWARDHRIHWETVEVWNMGTGSESGAAVPALMINSSNPVRGNASIAWTLPSLEKAALSIHDLAGRAVVTHAIESVSGSYSWNTGESPAGLYFVRLATASGEHLQKQVVVIR